MSGINKKIKIMSNEQTGGIVNVVMTTLTPTGDFEIDKARGETYAKSVGMDRANTDMAVVMATKGGDQAAKQMVQEFTTPDGGFDYMAMRQTYG